nr:hypothetical protein GCM10020092_022070 [Actinoplanes digitatis]
MFGQPGDLENAVRHGVRVGEPQLAVHEPCIAVAQQQDPDPGGVEEAHAEHVDLDTAGAVLAQYAEDHLVQLARR